MLVKPPSSRQTYRAGPEGRGDIGGKSVLTPQAGLRIQGVVDKDGQIEARPPHASPDIEHVRRWIRSGPRVVKWRCGMVRDERARIAAVENVFGPKARAHAARQVNFVFDRRRHIPWRR